MNKFRLLVAVLSITLVSCTSGSKQEAQKAEDVNSVLKERSEVIDSHTSQFALDWVGAYEGTLPCADCEGIETVVELKENQTYVAHYKYLGKANDDQYSEEGTFTWDDTGTNITLESENEITQYKVGENQLFLLTEEGDLNTGNLADLYVLKKKM